MKKGCVILIITGLLYGEKLLILKLQPVGFSWEDEKTKVVTKIFYGELMKESKYEIMIADTGCENVECAQELGAQKGVDISVILTLNKLEFGKYFLEVNAVSVEDGKTVYYTQYPIEDLGNIEVAVKLLAKSFLEKRPAEEVALEQEGGWKRKAKTSPAIHLGYTYFVGKNSYRREIADTTPEKIDWAEKQPQRAFDFEIALFYYLTNRMAIAFDARFQFVYRGMQLMVPFYYYFSQKNISPFVCGGPLFGFGPSKEGQEGNFWNSQRDGFGFLMGGGALFFRNYDLNIIATLKYTVIFNKVVDQGVALTFGLVWAPKISF